MIEKRKLTQSRLRCKEKEEQVNPNRNSKRRKGSTKPKIQEQIKLKTFLEWKKTKRETNYPRKV